MLADEPQSELPPLPDHTETRPFLAALVLAAEAFAAQKADCGAAADGQPEVTAPDTTSHSR